MEKKYIFFPSNFQNSMGKKTDRYVYIYIYSMQREIVKSKRKKRKRFDLKFRGEEESVISGSFVVAQRPLIPDV